MWAVANIWKPDLLASRTGKFTTPSPVAQGAPRCMCGSIQDPATLPQIFCFWYVHSQHLRPFQDSSSSTNFFTTSNSSRPMTRGKGVQGSLCPQHTSDQKSEDSVKTIKSNTMKYKAQFDRFHGRTLKWGIMKILISVSVAKLDICLRSPDPYGRHQPVILAAKKGFHITETRPQIKLRDAMGCDGTHIEFLNELCC